MHIEFTRAPIVPPTAPAISKEIGAQVEFQGIVREMENGKIIPGLFYEAHEPMARRMLEKILGEFAAAHSCEEVRFIHRLDFVPAGEASLFVRVKSKHRQAALQMTASLIDRLKSDVPIWKLASNS
ncbi:MAG: molybdopterin synthase catalytic subunit [Limisphaerales bacterium]